MTETPKLSIDTVAEAFSHLVGNEHWPAARFIEELSRDKWCNELFNLDHKSETFAVEAAFFRIPALAFSLELDYTQPEESHAECMRRAAAVAAHVLRQALDLSCASPRASQCSI